MWLCDASLAPPDVIHQAAPNRAHRVLQPVPLGGQHVQQLATPGDQRIQRLHGRIRERTRRGTDSLGEQRQAVGIQANGLAQHLSSKKPKDPVARAPRTGRFSALRKTSQSHLFRGVMTAKAGSMLQHLDIFDRTP